MLQKFSEWFWTDNFWLPKNFTWKDLQSTPEIRRPQMEDLYPIPLLAIGYLLLRYFVENKIALRFCKCIGISDASNLPEPNVDCESTFLYDTKSPDQAKLKEISMKTGWKVQQVTRWFRKMRSAKTNSLLKKATETCWRFFIYLGFFTYGCIVLFNTDWFWDSSKWMEGYLRTQHLSTEMRWYYLIELSFYVSLLVSQFYDTKRKDFWQQFVHHVTTIILISGSYIVAHYQMGSIIMLLHDFSDYWLEAAKIANYAKTRRLCDILFVCFAVAFYVSRWIFYPFFVLRIWITDNRKICGPLQSYLTFPYIFFYFCIVLLLLHIYWGYLIGKMIYKFTKAGKVEKDDRSDAESGGSSGESD